MNIKKIKDDRLKSLEKAYGELTKVLNNDLEVEGIDPEKMKIAASAYKLAADDSEFILKQMISLLEEDSEETTTKVEKDTKSSGRSPEQRIKR